MSSKPENTDGLHFKSCQIGGPEWHNFTNLVDYLPVSYKSPTLKYKVEYFAKKYSCSSDITVAVLSGDAIVAIWPLHISENSTGLHLTSCGDEVLAPLLASDLSPDQTKKITRACIEHADKICCENSIDLWNCHEQFFSRNDGVSTWHDELMRAGAKSSVSYVLYADLSLSERDYRKRLRKSYRSLINSAPKHFDAKVLDINKCGAAVLWEEFKTLHTKVAGRQTRSSSSWNLLYEMLHKKQADLIYIKDINNNLIGCSFFNHTANEVSYSVAAYERSLFDKPIGHAIQFKLIKLMRAKGRSWYRLGTMQYPSADGAVSAKEQGISKFKSGFATNVFAEFKFVKRSAQ